MRKIATTITFCCALLLVSYHACIFAINNPIDPGKDPKTGEKNQSQGEKGTTNKDDEQTTTSLFDNATYEKFESTEKLKEQEYELEIYNKDLLEPRR